MSPHVSHSVQGSPRHELRLNAVDVDSDRYHERFVCGGGVVRDDHLSGTFLRSGLARHDRNRRGIEIRSKMTKCDVEKGRRGGGEEKGCTA